MSDPFAPAEMEMQHRGLVKWFDAPVPPRNHECWDQTTALYKGHQRIKRCPCGAIWLQADDLDPGGWINKNERTE